MTNNPAPRNNGSAVDGSGANCIIPTPLKFLWIPAKKVDLSKTYPDKTNEPIKPSILLRTTRSSMCSGIRHGNKHNRADAHSKAMNQNWKETGKKWGKKIADHLVPWLLGLLGAAAAYKNWENGSSQTLLVYAGLFGSLFWKPSIALAAAATFILLYTSIPKGNPPIDAILIAWGLWLLYKIIRREKTGLEASLTGPLLGIGAIWMVTSGDVQGGGNLAAIALGVCLLSAGHHARIAIALICLFASFHIKDTNQHKNSKGRVMVAATAALMLTPGPIGKVLAVIPTHYNFTHRQAAGAAVTTAAIWLAWLAGLAYEKTPKRHRKKIVLALGTAALTVAIASPIWIPATLKFLNKSDSLTGRIPLWIQVSEWARANPWEGYGQQFWPNQGNQTSYTRALWVGGGAHNTPLEMWLFYGAGGMALGIAIAAAAALHKTNSPKNTLASLASWLSAMSETVHWNRSMGSCWPVICSSGQGDKEPETAKELPWKPTTCILGVGALWAAACLLTLPQQKIQEEELWIGQSIHPEWITGPNKTEKIEELIQDIKTNHPQTETYHLYRGLAFVVAANKKAEIEAAAQTLRKTHVFLRTLPQRVEVSLTRRNTLIAFFPLTIGCLFLLKNRKRTYASVALLAAAYAMSPEGPEGPEGPEDYKPDDKTIQRRDSTPDWSETPIFPKYWPFLLEENLRGEVAARILSKPKDPAYYNTTKSGKRERELQLSRMSGWPQEGELYEALYQTEEILSAYKKLEPSMPKDLKIEPGKGNMPTEEN